MEFSIVVCTDKDNGIGRVNDGKYKIPWKSKEDMKFFRNLTQIDNSAIIVGRNTYFTFPKTNNIPFLKKRLNIVLTSNPDLIPKHENVIVQSKLNNALKYCKLNKIKNVFVIGGVNVYAEALKSPFLKYIYWNIIEKTDDKCNLFFPLKFNHNIFTLDVLYNLKSIDNLKFYRFYRISDNEVENQYLNLLKKVLETGDVRQTRNSKTISLFGEKLIFNLRDNFPLLTTKKMFLRGIFEELVWFLRGKTDSKILENKKVNIWKWNSSREFLDKVHLGYKEGDIGNMYGFQWKHNGAEYYGCDWDYKNKGFNQIEYCLNLLKNDKYSRRILMTTYSPYNAREGVLYPCHGLTTQWYVKEEDGVNYLSCHMYQRSADMFLGVPFNISSYSLLTYMFCEILNNDGYKFKPDKLIISFGDLHIYEDHIEQVNEQIKRIPYKFPLIKFNKKVNNLDEFEWENVEIINYKSYPRIKANMIA